MIFGLWSFRFRKQSPLSVRDAGIGVREGEKTLPNFSLAAHDRAGRNEARGRGILTRCACARGKRGDSLLRDT